MATSVKELLAPGYEYAQELLSNDGGFPPFVIVLDVLDHRKVIVSSDGTVESLRDILAERYRRDVSTSRLGRTAHHISIIWRSSLIQ